MRVRCRAICLIALFAALSNQERSASKQLAPQIPRIIADKPKKFSVNPLYQRYQRSMNPYTFLKSSLALQ
jgi:hypothetical protein